jgi:hypothetical protein
MLESLSDFRVGSAHSAPCHHRLWLVRNSTGNGTAPPATIELKGPYLAPPSPGGAWTQIVLHAFTGSDGKLPVGVAIASGGILYGITTSGGANGYGTVFALAE